MSKAEKIRKIAKQHPDWSTTRIGEACDCHDAYVRVVLRQRTKSGKSVADLNYAKRKTGGAMSFDTWRYQNEPGRREAMNAYARAYRRRRAEREATHA